LRHKTSQEGQRVLSCLALAWAVACSLCGCSAKGDSDVQSPSASCAGCHLQEYRATTHPPHAGVRPTTCGVCHDEADWHPVRSAFVHSFPLDGGHAKAACFDCHRGPTPIFEGTTKQCVDCHQKELTSANAQIEHHSTFPSQCDTCHTTAAWKPTRPHDATFAAVPDNAVPRGRAAATSTPSAAEPVTKPSATKTQPTAGAVWPHNTPSKTSKPDLVTGASRVKEH
jgi:hypothetical protein